MKEISVCFITQILEAWTNGKQEGVAMKRKDQTVQKSQEVCQHEPHACPVDAVGILWAINEAELYSIWL